MSVDEWLQDLGCASDPSFGNVGPALGTVEDAEIAQARGQFVLEIGDLRMGDGQRFADLEAPLGFGPRPVAAAEQALGLVQGRNPR
jgi:hypothetical protein